ncbi:YfhO family protein [Weissella diestrammenae]|uniref:YfhO family protein n=1 Tax=Weissella diestrammenae TaxID=1162633 RepID=A0A7G9T3T6_9LACO|nr:YfhO family protein [Weissella diestrammenae]MCM0582746.1 YfhO family protein [Weissella diestrammenae]QNN74761.1 YfhO family protein [Weissella diestrammenae]
MFKKIINPLKWRVNTQALWISFLMPTVLMVGYFAYRHMTPFGHGSILTVDLGQQYIDFFAGYKQTLLHHPTDLLFSFTKGLGGETFGDWAYYLLSPFNLLLLPFTNAQLPAAILFLTAIKYGCASWSMAFALRQIRWQKGWALPVFGLIYAMMGWFVANQLNLMWLDGAILLPLIVVGFERFLDGMSHWRLTLSLTLIFIVNYYMAYMIGLFLGLYLIWRLFWQPYTLHERLVIIGKFTFSTLMSIGLATVIWLPTAQALMESKGQHMLEGLKNQLAYPPLDLVSKLFMGTFNFEQMKDGLPNIFVGSFVLILVWYFFTHREIRWQTRLAAGFVTLVLIISMVYDPVNIAWHGFSFPVWYPYRFSYVFSFWMIWLAASVWSPEVRLSRRQLIGFIFVLVLGIGWSIYRLSALNDLTWMQIGIGVGFLTIILVLQQLQFRGWWWHWCLGISIILEMLMSTVWTLDNFSYLNADEYRTIVQSIETASAKLPQKADDFYRVTKSFQRTKGDPLQGDFNGATTFSSALEHQQSDFMAAIGQPEGDNYIAYDGGTLLSDSLLGMRYVLQPNRAIPTELGNPSTFATYPRFDMLTYPQIAKTNKVLIQKNEQALPIAFAANTDAIGYTSRSNDPLGNQNKLWQSLTGQSENNVITSDNFLQTSGQNLNVPTVITGAFLNKQDANQPAELVLTYAKREGGPSYLTLGASIAAEDVIISVDGETLQSVPSHRHTIVVPLPDTGDVGSQHTIKLVLQKKSLWLQDVSLYTLNAKLLQEQASTFQAQGLKMTHFSSTKISGQIDMPRGENLLMSTIPASRGWTLYVDGKEVNQIKIANFFVGAVISPGKHRIEYRYKVPLLHIGGVVSIGFVLFLMGLSWSESTKRRHSLHGKPLH